MSEAAAYYPAMGYCVELPTGQRVVLRGKVVVGRDPRCQIVLDADLVSRVHAAFQPTADGYELCDLESTNGTWIDNQRLRGSAPIHAGSRVRIGDVQLLVVDPTASAGPVAASPSPPPGVDDTRDGATTGLQVSLDQAVRMLGLPAGSAQSEVRARHDALAAELQRLAQRAPTTTLRRHYQGELRSLVAAFELLLKTARPG
jgi:hypothetical protein